MYRGRERDGKAEREREIDGERERQRQRDAHGPLLSSRKKDAHRVGM